MLRRTSTTSPFPQNLCIVLMRSRWLHRVSIKALHRPRLWVGGVCLDSDLVRSNLCTVFAITVCCGVRQQRLYYYYMFTEHLA
jgi:hypothetical protein